MVDPPSARLANKIEFTSPSYNAGREAVKLREYLGMATPNQIFMGSDFQGQHGAAQHALAAGHEGGAEQVILGFTYK
jgi:hypothetical protein